MTATIIPFVAARKCISSARLSMLCKPDHRYAVDTSPSTVHPVFSKIDYRDFLCTMHTRNSTFMFPTILSKYRRGINPVDALYNYLQEVLFYFDYNNKTHTWVMSLFQNTQWTAYLIAAIEKDCIAIDNIQSQYSLNLELLRIRHRYTDYIVVFRSV